MGSGPNWRTNRPIQFPYISPRNGRDREIFYSGSPYVFSLCSKRYRKMVSCPNWRANRPIQFPYISPRNGRDREIFHSGSPYSVCVQKGTEIYRNKPRWCRARIGEQTVRYNSRTSVRGMAGTVKYSTAALALFSLCSKRYRSMQKQTKMVSGPNWRTNLPIQFPYISPQNGKDREIFHSGSPYSVCVQKSQKKTETN
jgi:hypothetical protein